MFSYLEERTPAEVEAIRRTIQELLRQTCILQVKYDPVTLTARDNARYRSLSTGSLLQITFP